MPRRSEPDPLALAIGQRVKRLREEAGLTIEKLAYESEFSSKGHLSSLERGLVMPTVSSLQRLADRLGVLVADLVTDPAGSDRERLLHLSREVPAGTVKKLVKDLNAAVKAKKPAGQRRST